MNCRLVPHIPFAHGCIAVLGTGLVALVTTASAQTGQFAFEPAQSNRFAGTYVPGSGGYAGDGGPATSASLNYPMGLTFDGSGNLYIADNYNAQVRVISPAGTISTVNTSGLLYAPQALTVDSSGNLFVIDQGDWVYKFAPDGTATSPSINFSWFGPSGIAADASGNVYISDNSYNYIYKYNVPTDTTTTIAGNETWARGDNGPASASGFYNASALAMDSLGNLYIADQCSVRVIYAAGTIPNVANPTFGYIYTIAGSSVAGQGCGYGGDGGAATSAQLNFINALAVDAAGDIFVSDFGNNVIRKIAAATGFISTVAGNGSQGYFGDGGPATGSEMVTPQGIALDASGNFYYSDSGNNLVREAGPQGALSFGVQAVGSTSPSQTVTIANRGSATLNFTAAPVVSGDFSVSTGNTCGVTGLAAGASCTLQVQFTPAASGARTGSITFADDGATTSQVLNLTGGSSAGTSEYDYGTVTLGISGATTSITVTANYGQGSTPASIASALASALAGNSISPVSAVQSGSGLTLNLNQPFEPAVYTYQLTTRSWLPSDFGPNGSFSASQTSGTLTGSTEAGSPATVYSYQIPSEGGYAANGNLLSYGDSVVGQWTFGYDGLDRLTAASGASVSGGPQFLCWQYDSFGNRLLQAESGSAFSNAGTCQAASGASLVQTSVQVNAQNQMTQVSGSGATWAPVHDGVGNVTKDNANNYLYDAEGRICAVAQGGSSSAMVGYLYDAGGQRVGKGRITTWSCNPTTNGFTLTSAYMLGPGGEQMTELTVNSGTPAWDHTDLYAGASLIGTYKNDNQGVHFRLTDWLGTMRAQTNYAGQLESTCTSLPFGDGPYCSQASDKVFTGKERDAESGLDYFGARYYASSMGRFMSPDWADKPEAVPYSDLSNPQSLNLYGYVNNNPLSKADPDGHCPECLWEEFAASPAGQAAVSAGDKVVSAIGAGFVAVGGFIATHGPEIVSANADYYANGGGGNSAWAPMSIMQSGTKPSAPSGPNASPSGQTNSPTGPEGPYKNTSENNERMKSGKAPIGNDGKPVELHHEGQDPNGAKKELTQTDHRGGDNYKNNHPNTGQEPSKIDRNQATRERRQHWKDKANNE